MTTAYIVLVMILALIAIAMGLSDRYLPFCPKCGIQLKPLGKDWLCITCDRVYLDKELPK